MFFYFILTTSDKCCFWATAVLQAEHDVHLNVQFLEQAPSSQHNQPVGTLKVLLHMLSIKPCKTSPVRFNAPAQSWKKQLTIQHAMRLSYAHVPALIDARHKCWYTICCCKYCATGFRLWGMVDEPPRPFVQTIRQFQFASWVTNHVPRIPNNHAKHTCDFYNTVACHVLVGTVRFSFLANALMNLDLAKKLKNPQPHLTEYTWFHCIYTI